MAKKKHASMPCSAMHHMGALDAAGGQMVLVVGAAEPRHACGAKQRRAGSQPCSAQCNDPPPACARPPQMRRFNLGPVGEADCPVFDGMFEFFRVRVAGGGGVYVRVCVCAHVCVRESVHACARVFFGGGGL